MTETTEQLKSVRNLERVSAERYWTYEDASGAGKKIDRKKLGVTKVKIFARSNGAFDLVAYKPIPVEPEAKPAKSKIKK